jgi:hypothetical protein
VREVSKRQTIRQWYPDAERREVILRIYFSYSNKLMLSGSRYHGIARPQVTNGGDGLQTWRIVADSRKGVAV